MCCRTRTRIRAILCLVRRVFAASLLVTVLLPFAAAATSTKTSFQHSIRRLTAREQAQLEVAHDWHPGCPTSLAQLRLLSVSAVGWDGKPFVGRLVVNADVASPLVSVFRQIYALRFPIRHMS